jgi:signal transduction histidine kinase
VKTERQSAKLNIEETDINALIDVILKRVTPIANQRGIELIYESYREVSAEVDEVKLSLALANLIENAIKYNVDNGWVKVSLNADHKNFYIKVADGGVGIPDDCKDMVFERFYRVDKARSRDTGGTGLGLAIARNAILVHDGTIKLYSESGKGTTFTVKVPLKHEATKQDER